MNDAGGRTDRAKFTVYSPALNGMTAAGGIQQDDSMHLKSQFEVSPFRRAHLLIILIFGAALASCAGNDEVQSEVQNITEAYERAQKSIERGNYRRGIQVFEAIQARFPFSDLARQIQLELLHAYYKSGNREQAIETADTFIRENPIHARVDYALYIKGLSYYEQSAGILERLFRKDTNKRPPKDVELAYNTFRRLVDRYPASEYSADAEQRMLAIKNRLAEYENYVADYYLRRGAYVAAVSRAKDALEEFHGAPGNERSLEIMADAYDNLGMHDLAEDARRILELNFPK